MRDLNQPISQAPILPAPDLSPCDAAALVAQLPPEVIADLAAGPSESGCHACGALNAVSSGFDFYRRDEPADRLMRWHTELTVHVPGRGTQQDPIRCGVLYGAAAALLAQRTAFSTKLATGSDAPNPTGDER